METQTEAKYDWSNKTDPIAAKMKEYEAADEVCGSAKLNPEKTWVVRLDGHHFSKFTKGFKRPFDERIFLAMLRTTKDLVNEFQAATGYTQSDEITLIFPPQYEEDKANPGQMVTKPLSFNGRIQKIVSLMAGYCSVRFSYHLSSQSFEADSHLAEKVSRAYFDARVFHVPSLENLNWRIRDVKRNSKNNLGHCNFKQKEMEGLNPKQVVAKLEEKGVSWDAMPEPYKWGVFVKKAQADKEGYDPKIQQTVTVLRSKWVMASFDSFYFPDESEEAQSFLSCKYTNEVLKFHQKFVDVA